MTRDMMAAASYQTHRYEIRLLSRAVTINSTILLNNYCHCQALYTYVVNKLLLTGNDETYASNLRSETIHSFAFIHAGIFSGDGTNAKSTSIHTESWPKACYGLPILCKERSKTIIGRTNSIFIKLTHPFSLICDEKPKLISSLLQ